MGSSFSASQTIAQVAGKALHLDDVVNAMTSLEQQIHGCAVAIAFVFLVLGTMQGFFSALPHKFLYQVVRSLILVALICLWGTIETSIGNVVTAFRTYPVQVTLANNQSLGSVPLDTKALENLILEKVGSEGTASLTPQKTDLFTLVPVIGTYLAAFHRASHLVNQILYALFLYVVLACQLIIVLMDFLQKAILVLFRFYVPIALGFHSSPSLSSLGHGFFKHYIGVQCWPVGWVFVNLVSFSLISQLTAPNPEDTVGILISLIAFIPILLWVLIGHLVGPFYAQKVITHGGQALQGMVGGIMAASGAALTKGVEAAGSAAVVAAGLAAGNPALALGPAKNNSSASNSSKNNNDWDQTSGSQTASANSSGSTESNANQTSAAYSGDAHLGAYRFATGIATLGGLSLLTAARAAGGLVQGIGGLTANAAGDSAQVDVSLVRHVVSGLSSSPASNRSSQRARRYVQSASLPPLDDLPEPEPNNV